VVSESPVSACLTILNFKKNPHMVLPQTTIYAIIGVYRLARFHFLISPLGTKFDLKVGPML
jgi:hypothetical protein